MTAFLSSLADSEGGKRLDRQGKFRAAALFQSGVVSQQEIEDGAKNGTMDSLFAVSGQRRSDLSFEGNQELNDRTAENLLAYRKNEGDRGRGRAQRMAEARYDALASESPAAGAVVGELPYAKAFATALQGQTEQLILNDRKPTLAPGSENN